MTESLAWRKEKQRRVGDEGGGKSKVKPVMTDWVVAVRKWIPGSGEEDESWEVSKNRVGRNDRLGSGNVKKGEKGGRKKERGGCQRPSGPE